MTCMSKPGRLSRDVFVSFRTTRKIRRGIMDTIERHIERNKVRLGHRVLSREAFLSSVMLEFMATPLAEQEAILARRVPEFEAAVAEEAASEDEASPLDVRPQSPTEIIDDRPPESPRKRKGKPA